MVPSGAVASTARPSARRPIAWRWSEFTRIVPAPRMPARTPPGAIATSCLMAKRTSGIVGDRGAVVAASGLRVDLGDQRAAKGDVQLLHAAADGEERHAVA